MDAIKGIEWCSFGGGAFTCFFPVYTNVTKFPDYLSKYEQKVSTDSIYWNSRLIAALVDSNFAKAVIYSERYQNVVFNRCYELINKYDKLFEEKKDLKLLEEANEKIIEVVKEETSKTLFDVLLVASNNMKTRYNREDN